MEERQSVQKWRRYYHLIKSSKLKEETGITLVELLAAISILSIVIVLAGSVHMFGQRQFIDQTKSASQANDMNYALTVMTTDLRKLKTDDVKVEENKIFINESLLYSVKDNKLRKADQILASNIDNQAFMKDTEGITITLKTTDQIRPKKKYETKIYFRR